MSFPLPPDQTWTSSSDETLICGSGNNNGGHSSCSSVTLGKYPLSSSSCYSPIKYTQPSV